MMIQSRRYYISIWFSIFFFIILLFHPIPNSVSQTSPITVGIDRHAAPIEFEENGQPRGFHIDLMNQIAENGAFTVEYQFKDWPDVLGSVENGTLDIMFAQITEERKLIYDFSPSILNITWSIYVTVNVVGISNIHDLANHTVAIIQDFASGEYLQEQVPNALVIPVKDANEGLKLLTNGEVFAFYADEHLVQYSLQQTPRSNIKQIGESISQKQMAIAVKKGNSALLSVINNSLSALFFSGQYQEIYRRWYGSSSTGMMDPFLQSILLYIITLLLIGICVFILWNTTLKRKVQIQTQKIQESTQIFRQFLDTAPFPIVYLTAEGIFSYINPAFYRVFGYSVNEKITMEIWFQTAYPDPEYRQKVMSEWKNSLKIVPNAPPIIRSYHVHTKTGIKLLIEFQLILLKNGECYVILKDITDQQKLEENRFREQRVQSLGFLAGGIAHDFNNLLMGLMGNLNLIQLEPDTEKFQPLLDQMEKAILRAKGISNQLLSFSKGGAPVKKIHEILPIIQECIDFTMHGSNCVCEVTSIPELPLVEIDSNQIAQAFQNLFLNSIQAMPQGGKILVDIKVEIFTEKNVFSLSSGDYLRISVSDNGVGIDPSNLEKIFTPYFTTKKSGTGLGLASAYSIIKNHGGIMTFDSKLHVGTTFTIYLPISHKTKEFNVIPQPEILTFKGKILLMDDDVVVVKAIQAMLVKQGINVDISLDGQSMIEMYTLAMQNKIPYDLVIMDLTVPGKMGGLKGMEILRQKDPNIKAIVSSGYSTDSILSDYSKYGFIGVLKKPYGVSELKAEISRIFKQ